MDKRELTMFLEDPRSALHRIFSAWSGVPLLLMTDVDWNRGPLVLVGLSDRRMWPLIPPGSLLQLDQRVRTIDDRSWPEFERPVYLIEFRSRFFCCYAQRRGETLRLISHLESPERPSINIPFKEAKVRGQLTTIFRPLPARGSAAGRPSAKRK